LRNLEEAGFIQTVIPFGRTSRDRYYRLVDEFSLFHLRWMAGRAAKKAGDWSTLRATPRFATWSGLAFESPPFRASRAFAQGSVGEERAERGGVGAIHPPRRQLLSEAARPCGAYAARRRAFVQSGLATIASR